MYIRVVTPPPTLYTHHALFHFQSLTSGVDNLIQKTKEELVEIKQESYFQKKEIPTEEEAENKDGNKEKVIKKKQWVDLDRNSFEEFDGEVSAEEGDEETVEVKPLDEVGKANEDLINKPEDKEEEEVEAKKELFREPSLEEFIDPDDDDDLFNTAFVDAVTSGEGIKFAVIPDDPVYDDDEDDPFNTEIANVVVKKQEEEKKKEDKRLKFSGLSSVADVLSGKTTQVDKSLVEQTVKRKRRRGNRINLIGDDKNEITAREDIATLTSEQDQTEPSAQLDVFNTEEGLPVPEGDLLSTSPLPVLCKLEDGENESQTKKENTSGLDFSEFELLGDKEAQVLTSNVAILSGEFSKPVEEEEDDFDAAFDALAQQSVTKSRLEDLEKQFENDDIFDTTCADKVLKLASLIDKVDDTEENLEDKFEDPFDTSAYDAITGEVETELEFESLANRDSSEVTKADDEKPVAVKLGPGDSAFSSTSAVTSSEPDQNEGWAAFGGGGETKSKKPPRPVPPRPQRPRPPRVHIDPADIPEAPSVVVKAPSTESIKSWNCSVADNLIRKSQESAAVEPLEEQEEYDPFDTKHVDDFDENKISKGTEEDEEGDIADPFDTSAFQTEKDVTENKETEDLLLEANTPPKSPKRGNDDDDEEEDNEEEEVPDVFSLDLLGSGQEGPQIKDKPIAPEIKPVEELDPFDTEFASHVLPDKGDPFNTSYVQGNPGKAELRALEEEFCKVEDVKSTNLKTKTEVKKAKKVPSASERARPKRSKISKAKEEEAASTAEISDPFDTSAVLSVEDENFDPSSSFKKSREIRLKQEEEADPFDTAIASSVLGESHEVATTSVDNNSDSDDFDPRA